PARSRRLQLGRDVLSSPSAVDKPFEQTVRCQSVGPVKSRAGDFARGPKAGEGCPALAVHGQPPHHIVRTGANGDGIARDVEVEAAAKPVDAREAPAD